MGIPSDTLWGSPELALLGTGFSSSPQQSAGSSAGSLCIDSVWRCPTGAGVGCRRCTSYSTGALTPQVGVGSVAPSGLTGSGGTCGW